MSADRRVLGHRPGHYYSPIPAFDDLLATPGAIWRDVDGLPGIDLNVEGQFALLEKLARFHEELPEEPTPGRRYYSRNGFYSAADGIVLHTMLCEVKPKRVIEIGSGFSSALMLDTNEIRLGGRTELTFIDPEPQRLFDLIGRDSDLRATILELPMQEVPIERFDELTAGDLLLVDSSHVTKAGSDVNRIFFDVLPRLAPGVHVHIHDAFWPFEYPRGYLERRWAWNELYLLRAFITFNTGFEITLFPSFLEARHADELERALPLAMTHPPNWPSLRGASIWLRRR